MDAMLAIIRRKLAGVSMSGADRNHIHHQLHRGLRTVRRAVITLYGVTIAFAVVGVGLAGVVMFTSLRVRFVYAVALALFGMIGALAVKAARRAQWEQTHPAGGDD